MATKCNSIQKSLAWCQGTPELPGVKRRIYYLAKSGIVAFPALPRDDNGRPTSAVLEGSFTLAADQKWRYIDILPDKSQLTSEAQGELPSQTQLNKLTAVHPGVGADASAAAAYINNSDNVFIVEDMKGNYRVLGNDKWATKSTVAQDLGQGATGNTSTTISVEATDEVPAPFYKGTIETEEGDLELADYASAFAPTTTLTTPRALSDDGVYSAEDTVATLKVADASIFAVGDRVEVQGVSGYKADGTTKSGNLILVVRECSGTSIKVTAENGWFSNNVYNIIPTIPKGSVLKRLS